MIFHIRMCFQKQKKERVCRNLYIICKFLATQCDRLNLNRNKPQSERIKPTWQMILGTWKLFDLQSTILFLSRVNELGDFIFKNLFSFITPSLSDARYYISDFTIIYIYCSHIHCMFFHKSLTTISPLSPLE